MADDQHPMAAALDHFIKGLDSLYVAGPMSLAMIGLSAAFAETVLRDFIKKQVISDGTEDIVTAQNYRQYKRLLTRFDEAKSAAKIVPGAFIAALTSQYDVFLSNVVTSALNIHPEILSSSERQFSFVEISGYGSIDELRSSLIDIEIDALLRKSAAEQFTWMETKFGLSLRSDLPVWPEFVELFQRRNLFVHADGKVSKQYLKNCSDHGMNTSHLKVGDNLIVDSAYFRRAHAVLFEIGTKLTQVLWRKLDPGMLEDADSHLNNVCFELLTQGKYKLARNLLDFAFSKAMKRFNKESELMLMVNRANAYRLSGDVDACKKIIGSDDWSAYAPKFQLARAVVFGDVERAVKLMKSIGRSGPPQEHDYQEWPLFKSVRKDPIFCAGFAEVFGKDLDESSDSDLNVLQRIQKELNGINTDVVGKAVRKLLSSDMGGWLEEFMEPHEKKDAAGSSKELKPS